VHSIDRSTFTLSAAALAAAMLHAPAASAQTESVIYRIASSAAGYTPTGGMAIDAHGDLFGVTQGIGNGSIGALAFELTPPAGTQTTWSETILADLGTATKIGVPTTTLVPDGKGGFFGATIWNKVKKPLRCPNFGGCGVVYDLKPPKAGQTAWSEAIPYAFDYSVSPVEQPAGPPLRAADGTLYGAINGGTLQQGAIYALTPPAPHSGPRAWTLTVPFSFGCTTTCGQGAYPAGNLVQDSTGAFYGVTGAGGDPACPGGDQGCGIVYKLTPGAGGWTETVLHSFHGGTDGAFPGAGLVMDSHGNLFGTTTQGGDNSCVVFSSSAGCGGVYELSPAAGGTWNFTPIYAFEGPAANDGFAPTFTLTPDATGALYGTTALGGPASDGCAAGGVSTGCGTVFKLTPPAVSGGAWTETVLHSFIAGGTSTDVDQPNTPITLGTDGTTLYGGANGGIYQITQ
jgi:uncharacterized repeat protein (TIGR03803 family)